MGESWVSWGGMDPAKEEAKGVASEAQVMSQGKGRGGCFVNGSGFERLQGICT